MKNKTRIGLILGLALFAIGFIINGNLILYLNISGILIVMGGVVAASLLSFKFEQLRIVHKVITSAYNKPVIKETEIIDILVDLSIRSRIDGILSLQQKENETTILFLRRALGCLVDGYRIEQIRDILNTEMYFFKLRREDSERVLRTIADFCPAFGLMGSVVGLIAMLGGVGDTSILLKSIPIALTSTLYGLLLANFFFLPFAATIKERTNHELLLQKIIMEGVIAIDSEINPVILKIKLESFLTPSEREPEFVSYSKLIERFRIQPKSETEEVEEEEENEIQADRTIKIRPG